MRMAVSGCGNAARRRLTKSSKVAWNSCNTGANSLRNCPRGDFLFEPGSGLLHSTNAEVAAYALDGVRQAFNDGHFVALQRLVDLCGYRTLLLHELPEKFQIKLPVAGHPA